MEKQIYAVGDRVEQLCAVCNEVRGQVVATVTRKGRISYISCPKCGTRRAFKNSTVDRTESSSTKSGAPYDWTRTYRVGQTMLHPAYGIGEVTAVIEPQKIDVLFTDRLRRLIHSRAQS